jgi:hypothetical protein
MAERVRISGKSVPGGLQNEGIDAQVSEYDELHTLSRVSNNHIDESTRALNTIEYEHHEIHSGSHYHVQSVIALPALNDVLDFTWQMPDNKKWIHWTWEISTEKEVAWYIYEHVVANNPLANTVTPLNNNRNSTNTSGTVMKYELQADLTAANVDTDVTSPAILIASGISGDGQKGGASERHHEMIMKQGWMYCLRAVAGAAGYINFDMHWYEHTNKETL